MKTFKISHNGVQFTVVRTTADGYRDEIIDFNGVCFPGIDAAREWARVDSEAEIDSYNRFRPLSERKILQESY